MKSSLSHTLKTIVRHFPLHRKPAGAAILLVLATFTVHAAPIIVPDASFESPNSPTQTSTNPNAVSGWVFNVKGGSVFGTMAISPNFASPTGSSGDYGAFINNDAVNVTDTITSAASLATITPLTKYTLTVAIGNVVQSDARIYGTPGPVSFSLLANGAVIATQEVLNGMVPNGTFQDFSLTFASPSVGSVIGDKLTIQLATLPQQGSAYKAVFDNVTLDATNIVPPAVVPEPRTSSLILMGLGGLAIFCLMRRRQLS